MEGMEDYRYKVNVFGEGKDGKLFLEPKELNFGIIMVNFVKTGKFVLFNKSDTTFNVVIELQIEGEISDEEKEKLSSFFLIDFQEGIIPAKSKREINVTFNPRDICDFKMKIMAKLRTNEKDRSEELN